MIGPKKREKRCSSAWNRCTALHITIPIFIAWCLTFRMPVGNAASSAAGPVIRKLLMHPLSLQLAGSQKSRKTFFFRIHAQSVKPPQAFSVLAASKSGRVTVVLFASNGLIYGYYGDGLFVLVDTHHPGTLDVYHGVSPEFLVGSAKGKGRRPPDVAFAFLPVVGNRGAVVLDLSGPLRMLLTRSTQLQFFPEKREIVLQRRHKRGTVFLSPPGSQFPVRAVDLFSRRGHLVICRISPGAEPLQRLFGLTTTKLKASGVTLDIRRYQAGEQLPWLPPVGFGSKPGEVRAAVALERLMPISKKRELARRDRWMAEQIAVLGARSVVINSGPHGGMRPLERIFGTLEWGGTGSLQTASIQAMPSGRHQGLDWRWNFDRRVYFKGLQKVWGPQEMENLVALLARRTTTQGCSPYQWFMMLDLLSDIGPAKADAGWASKGGQLAAWLSANNHHPLADALIISLFRARWDMPLSAQQIQAAKMVLTDGNAGLVFRTRALEVLCFTGQLPYEPRVIVPLVKSSLENAEACLTSPTSGRYMFDLSLCRNGRKILLKEWLNPHSRLGGNRQLPLAVFNRLWPGSPGYNLAIAAALKVFHNPGYGRATRRQAIGALCHAPQPIFRKVAGQILKTRSDGLSMVLSTIGARKLAKAFIPAMVEAFPHLEDEQIIQLMSNTAFGFKRGSDASSALPLIVMALRDERLLAVQMGLNAIGDMHYEHVHLPAASLYPVLLRMVRAGVKYRLRLRAEAAYCFGWATHGQWSPPAAGILPPDEGGPNLSVAGKAWWRIHYAAVRRSALRWAAAHPNYPRAAAK